MPIKPGGAGGGAGGGGRAEQERKPRRTLQGHSRRDGTPSDGEVARPPARQREQPRDGTCRKGCRVVHAQKTPREQAALTTEEILKTEKSGNPRKAGKPEVMSSEAA